LLSGLAKLTDRPFTTDQIDRLLELAGHHPFFLQLAGAYLETALADPSTGSGRGLLPDDWLLIRRRFLAEAEDHYRYLWSQLDSAEQSALLHLNNLKPEALRQLQAKALALETEPFSEGFAEFLARRTVSPDSNTPPVVAPIADTDNLTGITLGNYRVLAVVGRGGMATVYQGYQPSLDRYVAIKVLSSSLQSDPEFNDRFKREAETVGKLRHQNILQMLDFGSHGALSYMVMEFINGQTLKEYIRDQRASGRRLPPEEIVYITNAVAAALDYAHDHGLVHRDVKPANIMLRNEPNKSNRNEIAYTPILTDFGVARMLEGLQRTGSGQAIGTPDYMSPEQARGEPAGPRSDIYALGVVVYEMVTGQLPFSGESPLSVLLKHLHEQPPAVRLAASEVTEELEMTLNTALAKDPIDRFAHPTDLAFAVAQAYRRGDR
jgi:serine/threonine protein kinase